MPRLQVHSNQHFFDFRDDHDGLGATLRALWWSDPSAANARLQLQQHSHALSKFDGISARAHLMSRDSVPSTSSSFPSSSSAAAASKANDAAFNSSQLQVA